MQKTKPTPQAINPVIAKIEQSMTQTIALNLLRKREVFSSQHCHDFSSNDYLALAQSSILIDAMIEGVTKFGSGSKASPLITGYTSAHQQLERALCQETGHQAGMLFCSGFSANHSLICTLFGSEDKVIADKLAHASIIDGLRQSGCQFKRYRHNDLAHLEQLLVQYRPSAVITESVFSMDGDWAPLLEIKQLCQKYQALLIIDDAHGFGCAYSFNSCNASTADIQIVTFGKALGSQGAAILANQQIIDFLVAQSRDYIYSTALSPANAWTTIAAVNAAKDTALTDKLTNNIKLFKQLCQQHKIETQPSDTAIQPLVIGQSEQTIQIARQLKAAGFLVGAIRPPTVPKGSARLRITLSAAHTDAEITSLVQALSSIMFELNC